MRGLILIIILSMSIVVEGKTPASCQTCKASDALFEDLLKAQHKLPGLKKLFEQPTGEISLNKDTLKIMDLGVIGKTFHIQEMSMLDIINTRLREMEADGSLEAEKRKIQQKVIHTIKHPSPLSNIGRAKISKISEYDPTFEVMDDIYDHNKNLIHQKGKRINPLDHLAFGEPLIFIDGLDRDQVNYAQELLSKEGGKITLVGGGPNRAGESNEHPYIF